MKTQVTIIGFGTMGQAIAKALVKNDRAVKVFGIDKDDFNPKIAVQKLKNSDFIILAVKPQNKEEAIEQIKNYINPKTILISIMAGVTTKKLILISGHHKIIRMMPNLGLAVGEGIAAWKGEGLSKLELKKAKDFMNKITENFKVKNEDMINKVTAISGSGPAYFFLLADCLIKASLNLGFTQDESKKLVAKTFKASALLSKEADYLELIKKVASKGGTTEAALAIFQKENFNKIVAKAVSAAYKRASKLGK